MYPSGLKSTPTRNQAYSEPPIVDAQQFSPQPSPGH